MQPGVILQHEPSGPPARFGAWLEDREIPYELRRVWEDGTPSDPAAHPWICSLGSDQTPSRAGGPGWVEEEVDFLRRAVTAEVPVLGICFGGEALAAATGARIAAADPPEVGWSTVESTDPRRIPSGPWLHFHYDQLLLPAGASEIARSPAGTAAFALGPHLGLQFHPEATPEIAERWASTERTRSNGSGSIPCDSHARDGAARSGRSPPRTACSKRGGSVSRFTTEPRRPHLRPRAWFPTSMRGITLTRYGRTAALTLSGLAVLLGAGGLAGPAGGRGFKPLDSATIEGLKLFDLGVADANDDGNLDVFTTNHKFNSSLLVGDGDGGLTEARVAAGLSPTQAFPGYEDLRRDPVITAPGVYLYATDRDQPRDPFHIDTTAIGASGRLIFAAQDLQVESASGATVSTSRLADGSSQLDFVAVPGAAIDVSVEHIDLPITVQIDSPLDPAQIKVGADAVPATARDFVLSLRDRHGFGFADFDADGASDLFISTGGLGGEIVDPFFAGRQSDELLLARAGGYANATGESGLVKGTCRGRGVSVADFDGDGNLDLLEACELAAPQVYTGDGQGHFLAVAAPPAPASTYRVADLIGDRRPEILAASGASIGVWRSVDGAWSLAQAVRTLNGELPVQHLALGDYDGDGEIDVFAASKGGNTMLRSVDGRLRRRDPRSLGLPAGGGRAATFVDYDNDGDLDLDLMPQGLYEARDGTFRRTGQLAYGPLPTGRIGYAITTWPDLDEDGRRDPLSARGRGEFAAEQFVDRRRNTTRGGHWLEVDLAGPSANSAAIGASVRVQTDAGSSYGWVGQSDDSRYASGHYRLYFGLGGESRIERVVVTWPDGTRKTVRSPGADRVIRVDYRSR